MVCVWQKESEGVEIFVVVAVFYLLYVNHVGFREVVTWGFMRFQSFVKGVVGLLR